MRFEQRQSITCREGTGRDLIHALPKSGAMIAHRRTIEMVYLVRAGAGDGRRRVKIS